MNKFICVLVMLFLLISAPSYAQPISGGFYPPDSKPFGFYPPSDSLNSDESFKSNAISLSVNATSLDSAMFCNITALAFFQRLMFGNIINAKPYRSEDNIFYFHPNPKFLKLLSAYGMHVSSVFGFASDQLMFPRGPGAADDIYGVIVNESIANVQAQLHSMGSTSARTYRIDKITTSITCYGAPS